MAVKAKSKAKSTLANASVLSDPSREAEARAPPRQRFTEPPKVSLKALLAAAPFSGIDLDRSPDAGREFDL
jgi:hypothetical protein